MPWLSRFVAAEVVLTHKDVSVYHTYTHDDPDQGQRTYWFVLRPEDGECDESAFDVRSLDVPSASELFDKKPRLPDTDPRFAAATPAEREQLESDGRRWCAESQPALIRAVLVEAIEAGLLVAPPESED